ncbi:hypothetical protein PGQ11_007772 [Apiospora arundinis]|uniref:Uncharacterized protein n=1 Tax=Apiospora arundinis TaxID=335852 RepID=A0ABR2IWJ1_9PEZI
MPDTTPYEDNGKVKYSKKQIDYEVNDDDLDPSAYERDKGGMVSAVSQVTLARRPRAPAARTVGRATGTKDATDKVGNTVKSITDTAGDAAEGVTGAVGDTVNDTTSGATSKVGDIVGETAGDAGETVNDAEEGIAEKTGVVTEKGGKTVEGAEDKIDKAGDNVEVPEGAEDVKGGVKGAFDMADEAIEGAEDQAEEFSENAPIEVSEFGPSITVKVVHIFEGSFIVSDNGQVKDHNSNILSQVAKGTSMT